MMKQRHNQIEGQDSYNTRDWRAALAERFRGPKRGQSLLLVALLMTLLLLFVGLGVDVANLMGRRSKLQSAVDHAALSAAQLIVSGQTITATGAVTKAYQILEGNGVPLNTLASRSVDAPAINQVRVRAVQNIETYFMRLVPAWSVVTVSAQATADLNSYAELNAKPYGVPGVVSELNLQAWGPYASRRGGDAYSPLYVGNGSGATNTQYAQQPYGYLFRVDVPASYTNDELSVQIWDPDGYNRPGTPPPWPTPPVCPATPTPGPGTPTPIPCNTATPTPSPDMYASCLNPRPGLCTSNGQQYDPGIKLNGFPSGRAAFWRADEWRTIYTLPIGGINDPNVGTETQYTLWHFDPRITSAFADPVTLSDQPGGAYVARYTWTRAGSQACPGANCPDLRWYEPSGFKIRLRGGACGGDCYERESTGGWYFYLYVQTVGGSSENDFDLRVGPPQTNYNCNSFSEVDCYVNKQYYDNWFNGLAEWQDGGARVFAKRALPLNLATGDKFPLYFTQVSKNAGGQTLGVRHFDQDCNNGCGSTMEYEMYKCGCTPVDSPACWQRVAYGYIGPNDGWWCGTAPCADPKEVPLPVEGTTEYQLFFDPPGPLACDTTWLRIKENPSYSNDTTVWEMPYKRPRLVR